MKTFRLVALVCVLCLCLFGCSQQAPEGSAPATTATASPAPTPAPTPTPTPTPAPPDRIPSNTTIAGIDISGMTPTDACIAITAGLETYTFTLNVNGKELTFSAQDMALSLSEENLRQYLEALVSAPMAEAQDLAAFDVDTVLSRVASAFRVNPTNASVRYSSAQGEFVIHNSKDGTGVDLGDLESQVAVALGKLSSSLSAQVYTYSVSPAASHTDARVLQAAEKANAYLCTSVTYNYETPGMNGAQVAITKADIADFVHIDSSFSVSISQDAVRDYVSKMAQKYYGPSFLSAFITTAGYTIPQYQVPYYSAALDVDAMVADLLTCLEDQSTGLRQAPYTTDGVTSTRPYGGNYIELSLDEQKLWLYRNGAVVLSSDVVTGSIVSGDITPPGMYSVTNKFRNINLQGDDYIQYVSYWIGFIGSSYGFHDATWRYSFGGDIYLYNGSHGCVNMPTNKVSVLYNNVTVGTKVIVHGAVTSILKQEITGTQNYKLTSTASPFQLDATAKYAGATLSYASSDSSVASVDADGTVTVHKTGTATITVSSKAYQHFTSASFSVTITVAENCGNGQHTVESWTQTQASTCGDAGKESGICSQCGTPQERDVPPTGQHTVENWSQTQAPTCGDAGKESGTCGQCGTPQERDVPPTGQHSPNAWVQVTAPGCETAGLEETTCSICGNPLQREVAATEHAFAPQNPQCSNGCGTANPDYAPPVAPNPSPELTPESSSDQSTPDE